MKTSSWGRVKLTHWLVVFNIKVSIGHSWDRDEFHYSWKHYITTLSQNICGTLNMSWNSGLALGFQGAPLTTARAVYEVYVSSTQLWRQGGLTKGITGHRSSVPPPLVWRRYPSLSKTTTISWLIFFFTSMCQTTVPRTLHLLIHLFLKQPIWTGLIIIIPIS